MEGANVISHFRPIALANFSFKMIPKIMADRLGPIASCIISAHQSAFPEGWQISDCVVFVYEGFNLLDRIIFGGQRGCRSEAASSFTTITLCGMETGETHNYVGRRVFRRRKQKKEQVLRCTSDVLVTEEALSRGMSSLFDARKIKPISMLRGCLITHVLYADYHFIFCRGDISSLNRLQLFLDEYGAASS
ncbi:uncharacterized protein LOC133711768 [Rosa rugosa]|uniref:uncharacterized protein LOC133711768 n=1 Tax=Rosa rugosa TaxID=74645 RepID=UPI002B412115|nr:uncharacterized protein LOC133711768 [Rosa rugosa]